MTAYEPNHTPQPQLRNLSHFDSQNINSEISLILLITIKGSYMFIKYVRGTVRSSFDADGNLAGGFVRIDQKSND